MWQSFHDLLRTYGRAAPWEKRATAAAALQTCRMYIDTCLPHPLAEQVQPLHLRQGVLTLSATHPAIAQRIQQEASALLQFMRERGFLVARLDVRIRGSSTAVS